MKEINTIAISGGGIKGLAYIGVFKKLEEIIQQRKILESHKNFDENNCKIPLINIKTICSVSVGSIFSLTYLLGYNYIEMLEKVLNKNFETLKNIKFFNFVSSYGLDDGKKLIDWLRSLMKEKNIDSDITLLDFYKITNVDFQIMASNLNKYVYQKFNHIETPDVKILDAIRMSISIPFIFTSNKYNNDTMVDGALIGSYPIELFKDNLDNVLGLKLVNQGELISHDMDEKIDDIESFIYHVLNCYMVQKEKPITRSLLYDKCTVYINTEDITECINFNITPEQKHKLVDLGYKNTSEYFKKYFNI
jgi:NTE family protein